GTPDPGFGSDGNGQVLVAPGQVLTLFPGAGPPRAIGIQSDGTVIVVGDARDKFAALAGYTSEGRLDLGFGKTRGTRQIGVGRGRVFTLLPGAGPPRAIGIQPMTDEIVVVGDARDKFAALAKYTADGTLEGTFGTKGPGQDLLRPGRILAP